MIKVIKIKTNKSIRYFYLYNGHILDTPVMKVNYLNYKDLSLLIGDKNLYIRIYKNDRYRIKKYKPTIKSVKFKVNTNYNMIVFRHRNSLISFITDDYKIPYDPYILEL